MNVHRKTLSKEVQARIQRHKRVRYHNDAALFHEETYSKLRKRTKALLKAR